MRYFLLTVLLIVSAPAWAQSRAVHDTFRNEREDYLKTSEDTRKKYQDDGVVIMKERQEKAKEVDKDRADRRDETAAWMKDWFAKDKDNQDIGIDEIGQ